MYDYILCFYFFYYKSTIYIVGYWKEKEAIYFIASYSHHLYSFINDLFALITS